MAVLKVVLLKAKATKDGKHKIRIAIYHRHETTYIITRFLLDSEKEFKDGRVVKRNDASIINSKLRHLINIYQDRIDEIANPEVYSCQQIKDIITSRLDEENRTFQSVCYEYMEELIAEGRKPYADLLEYNCDVFTSYTHGEMPLVGITPEMIEGYKIYLKKKRKLSEATINMQLTRTKVIINKAIKSRYVAYSVHPFITTKISQSEPKESDISVEAMQKICYSTPQEKKKRVAKDLFMLSFYLGGANLIDLCMADYNKPEFTYVRTKTRNKTNGKRKVILSYNNEALEIINRWKRSNGKLDFGYCRYENLRREVSRGLHKLVDELGITEDVSFYSARKSFAQYANDLGIKDGIVDYCLGHSDGNRGVIRFYSKAKQIQGDMAIRSVIDYMKDPQKFQEVINMQKKLLFMEG